MLGAVAASLSLILPTPLVPVQLEQRAVQNIVAYRGFAESANPDVFPTVGDRRRTELRQTLVHRLFTIAHEARPSVNHLPLNAYITLLCRSCR